MKRKDYLDILILSFVFITVTIILMSFKAIFNVDTESQWIGFYGDIFGGLIGALIAFKIMKRQIDEDRKNLDDDRKIKYKLDLEINAMKDLLIVLSQLKNDLDTIYETLSLHKDDAKFIETIDDKVHDLVSNKEIETDQLIEFLKNDFSKKMHLEFKDEISKAFNNLDKSYLSLMNLFDTYQIILQPETTLFSEFIKALKKFMKFSLQVAKSGYNLQMSFDLFNYNGVNDFNNIYKTISMLECKTQTRILGDIFQTEAFEDSEDKYSIL